MSEPLTGPPVPSVDCFSDDALVARLYELAAQLTRNGAVDRAELARIDAVVYRRLAQAYSKDPHEPDPQRLAPRLDS